MIDKGRCDKGFIWGPSNFECECDKSCAIGRFLDYENCKCRKKIVDQLAEECSDEIDGNKMIYNTTVNENVCNSCTIYIVLLVIAFLIIIGYLFLLVFKIRETNINTSMITNINANTETVIY